ncbi:hypothetical protein [Pseudoduganella chitinolytica]|uniref:Uncharacterized protein n=1 Tax=Pseudoduganella chitinolytica TaxID=34070 RepID=A0ABY8BEL9_9BURK|nr:hypothetical protein [Pseudoduganella chitinolytica]WEF33411.1 hypothetical protein PX653_01060 [Pseudoduganella chitinolytica]
MTIFSIAVDGDVVAAVDNDDLAMLSVHLRGSVTEPHAAVLSCDGTLTAGHADGYRVWLRELQLRAGQVVTIRMDDASAAVTPAQDPPGPHHGLSPESVATLGRTFVPHGALDVAAARSHPRMRPGFSFALATSNGKGCEVRSGPADELFQCLVMWTLDWEPECARIQASATSRERILRREAATPAFEGRLFRGDSVAIRCGD